LHLRNLQLMRWTGRQRQHVYEQVMAIETGFEQAVRGLGSLRKSTGFEESEIERLSDLTAEARAATLSYLTNIIEAAETDAAARLQGRRLKRERREES
jgi:hypothetical protein